MQNRRGSLFTAQSGHEGRLFCRVLVELARFLNLITRQIFPSLRHSLPLVAKIEKRPQRFGEHVLKLLCQQPKGFLFRPKLPNNGKANNLSGRHTAAVGRKMNIVLKAFTKVLCNFFLQMF